MNKNGRGMKATKLIVWFSVFILFAFLGFMLTNNKIALPGTDKNNQIYTTVYDTNGQTTVLDQNGKAIQNPYGINPVDILQNVTKGLVILVAAFAYWQLVGIAARRPWLRISIFAISVPVFLIAATIISFNLYFAS